VRWNRGDVLAALCAVIGLALVVVERAPLSHAHQRTKEGGDVYTLAPPQQVVVTSLGYRAAAADLILAHALVSAGLHLQEKRLFEFAADYLDTVNALDPKFRDGYRFADAIITLQTVPVPVDKYYRARDILRRGTRELPYDQELWSAAGQFLAYLAPSVLKTEAEREAWRQEGARFLARACELIGTNENIPYHCYTASTLFSRAGNNDASRALLHKMRLLVDDPDLLKMIDFKLATLEGESARQEARERSARFERWWRDDMPSLSRVSVAALGPGFDPFACARANPADASCATSFRDKVAASEDGARGSR
jgi:hypothetical protein